MRRDLGPTVTLKHVQTLRRGDRVYRYVRQPGKPRVRLPDLPMDDPRFLAAYIKAVGETPRERAITGTIAALIEAYLRSDRHLSLSADYRRVIRAHLEEIRRTGGRALAAHLRPQHIRADLATLAPIAAGKRLKAWRQLCCWAAEAGLLSQDPSEGIRAARAPRSDGHPPWSHAEIDAYRDRWKLGTVQRLAFEIVYWTGCRIVDAVALGPGMIGRDGILAYRQSKTGGMAYVPWTCPVPGFAAPGDREMLHAAIAARPSGHLTYLATPQGTRNHKSLGNMIRESARAAEVERSAHGLRKSRAIQLAEGGATELQIGSWTGHTTLGEIVRYTRQRNRRAAVAGTEQDQNSVNTPGQL